MTERKYSQKDVDDIFSAPSPVRYPADCKRICKAIKTYRGIVISQTSAHMFWESYSDDMAAGWLYLPEKDEMIVEIFDKFISERMR